MSRPKTTGAESKRARGQAMVEYSILTWLLAAALLLGATVVKMKPTGGGPSQNVMQLFFTALQQYYDSFYYVLNLPFP